MPTAFPLRIAVLVVAAALAMACSSQPAAGGGPSGDSKPPKGSRVDSRTVFLDTESRSGPDVHTVLRTEDDRARFPGWFTAKDQEMGRRIAERIKGTDLKTHALVAYTATSGCSKPHSVALYADGNRLALDLIGLPSPPPECYAPYRVLAVFEVARNRVPNEPRFGQYGKAPDPAGPGEMIAFTEVATGNRPRAAEAAEVTTTGDLDRWLSGLPAESADRVRAELAKRHNPREEGDERRFAFLLSGCRLTGAELHTETGRLTAVPLGGTNVRCARPEYYAAVFALSSSLVPNHPLS